MRAKELILDLADVDDNGICENQTTAGADELVLNGALCDTGTAGQFDVGDAYSGSVGGVKIAIDAAGDISAVNFLVTGKDADGRVQTETITGVTTTAVQSTGYWSQITSIAADAEVASNVFVGTVDEAASRTYPLDYVQAAQANVGVDVTGTINFTVQETFDILQREGFDPQQDALWTAITALSAKTADTVGQAVSGASAVRLVVNSYSSGAEARMIIRQPYDC